MSGMEAVSALKKASTWGTAVAAGANDGLLINEATGLVSRGRRPDKASGQAVMYRNDQGLKRVDRRWAGDLRYRGFELVLALLFGTAGIPTDLTGAYQHDLVLAADIDGLFATKVDYDGLAVWESPGAKVVGVELNSKAGDEDGLVQIALDFLCDDLIDDSSVNTTSTITSVTVPDRGNRVVHEHLTALINDQGGAALASGDEIALSEVRFRFKRPMVGDYTNQAVTIREPKQTGMPEFELTLVYPEWDSTIKALLDDLLAGNNKKASLAWQGSLISGSNYYKHHLQFPNLEPLDYEELRIIRDERIAPVTLNFGPLGAENAPTGMSGITMPVQWSIINTLSTDPLA